MRARLELKFRLRRHELCTRSDTRYYFAFISFSCWILNLVAWLFMGILSFLLTKSFSLHRSREQLAKRNFSEIFSGMPSMNLLYRLVRVSRCFRMCCRILSFSRKTLPQISQKRSAFGNLGLRFDECLKNPCRLLYLKCALRCNEILILVWKTLLQMSQVKGPVLVKYFLASL